MTISLSGTGHRAPNSLQFGSADSEGGWTTVTSRRRTKKQSAPQVVTGPNQPSSAHQSHRGNRYALLSSLDGEGSDSEKPSSPLPSRRQGHSLDIDEEPSSPFLVGRRVHHGPFVSLPSRRDDHSSFSRFPSRSNGIGFDEEDDEFLSSSQHERLSVGAKKGKKVEKADGGQSRKPKSPKLSDDSSWSLTNILSMLFSPFKALYNWLASWFNK